MAGGWVIRKVLISATLCGRLHRGGIRPHRALVVVPSWPVGWIAVLTLALVACTSPRTEGLTPSAAKPGPSRVEIVASELKFEPASIRVTAGTVTFVVRNAGAIEHNFVIEDAGGRTVARIPVLEVGRSEELTVTLGPGTYTMVCTYPGHKEGGMVGTIEVIP